MAGEEEDRRRHFTPGGASELNKPGAGSEDQRHAGGQRLLVVGVSANDFILGHVLDQVRTVNSGPLELQVDVVQGAKQHRFAATAKQMALPLYILELDLMDATAGMADHAYFEVVMMADKGL